MASGCSSPVCDTVVTYQKGSDLRGSLNGLTNIPFPAVRARSQINAGTSVNYFEVCFEFKGISADVELGLITKGTKVMELMRGCGNSGWFCPGCVNVSQHIANIH